MTKLLRLGILFATAVKAVIVAHLVILGILPLISFILTLREVVVAKLVIRSITPLTSFTLALRVVLVGKFVISSILLHHLVYLKQREHVLIYQHLIYLLHFSN